MEKEETELRELEAEEASKDADMSDTKTVVALYLTAIGRKKGSTDKSKEEFARPKEKLSEDIAVWWNTIKRDENHSTQLFEVVATQKTLAGLEHVVVKEPMIISRVSRGNFLNVKEGLTSPMERLEPTLCCMLKVGSRMGQYVWCIDVANELRRRLMYD